MPTYDYECDACGHAFEKFQPITARSIRKCPSCGKLKVRRLIGTGAGIIFKGSGFYQTDYRSESYRKDAAKDKEDTDKKGPESSKSDGSGKSGEKGEKSEKSEKGEKGTAKSSGGDNGD